MGCIEDENRPNQETFECIECGYKDNADFNAAKNIRNRVLVTVLRESLLKQLDNGAFENVKRLKKYCYRFEGTCKRMQVVNV